MGTSCLYQPNSPVSVLSLPIGTVLLNHYLFLNHFIWRTYSYAYSANTKFILFAVALRPS